MKQYQESAAEPIRQSPVEEAFNEIEIALKLLAEAVERIGCKTSDIRYCRPCDPYADKTGLPTDSSAPLVMRLRSLKTDICRQADNLNNLSDEIQL